MTKGLSYAAEHLSIWKFSSSLDGH